MNTKIKVFSFEVSNCSSVGFSDEKNTAWYIEKQKQLKSPADIEKIINDFIENKDIINIMINSVDSHYHNNGGGNTVVLFYTVYYRN